MVAPPSFLESEAYDRAPQVGGIVYAFTVTTDIITAKAVACQVFFSFSVKFHILGRIFRLRGGQKSGIGLEKAQIRAYNGEKREERERR